jgi:hypothetical protein
MLLDKVHLDVHFQIFSKVELVLYKNNIMTNRTNKIGFDDVVTAMDRTRSEEGRETDRD